MPLKIDFVEDKSGNRMIATGDTVEPLGFDEIVRLSNKPNEQFTFDLKIIDAMVSKGGCAPLEASILANVTTKLSSRVFALVEGGWLPSALALQDGSLLIPDRNIVGEIRARFKGKKKTSEFGDDFFDLVAGNRLIINPILYAMEGSAGDRSPDENQLLALYEKASIKIKEALPDATVIPIDAAVGAINLLKEQEPALSINMRFLVKIAPLLTAPLPRGRLYSTWLGICQIAKECKVHTTSLLMIVLASAIFARQGLNPARGVLKPKHSYGTRDAYNSLADLRALEMLIASCCFFPGKSVAFLTADRQLAHLWAGLQAHAFHNIGGVPSYTITLHRSLLARLSPSQSATLFNGLSNDCVTTN